MLNRGRIVLRGRADELRDQPERLERAYFGEARARLVLVE